MPGYLRTGGYLRHVQPMALRDGITEWARTFFQEEDRIIKYPFLKRRTRSTSSLRPPLSGTPASSSSKTSSTDYWAVVQALFCTTFFYGYSFSWSSSTGPCCFTQIPLASSEVEGRWQWPSLDCHSFYSTACAFGLTWRPLTGSLCLSSFFWCRLKPGPSGERGR